MAAVVRAEARRDQQLEVLSEQLVSRVAKELLGLAVDEVDAFIAGDDQHRVGRGVEQLLRPALGGGEWNRWLA
jgi:hypothetical protein